ncbi:MAG: hypothetical protein GYB65_08015 [Chloroflexi bacterium]|nr:hypothetical protein [Chloroflexota bacterium]
MITRRVLLLLMVLGLLLAACDDETAIDFKNNSECGSADVTLVNTTTNAAREIRIPQGESIKVEVGHGIEYAYLVEYPSPPPNVNCYPLEGTIELTRERQTATVNLESATPTPLP